MRALVQRVEESSVTVEDRLISRIGRGLLVLLGIAQGDNEAIAKQLAGKVTNLRIFSDENGKMNRSVLELGAEILVVSQFTLYGDSSKGTRPSFSRAAPPDKAQYLYEEFARQCEIAGARTATGVFRAHMKVHLINDGPVTLMCSVEAPASETCTEAS